VQLRPLCPADEVEVVAGWGDVVARRGELIAVTGLAGFAAVDGDAVLGVVTYSNRSDGCEIVTLEAYRRRCGVGRALVDAVATVARDAGCARLWLVTTNDNTDAQAFYRATGFSVVAVRRGAVDAARRTLKPSIPVTGHGGVAIRDEIELHRPL
jgi:ribosomal protein S18 acetylase RimI-like enzyme